MALMDIESTYSFFNNLTEDNNSFMYHGNLSEEITDKAIQVSDSNQDISKEPDSLKKNVSVLMAECIQNIIRQSDPAGTKTIISKPGVFLTRNIGDTYCTTSAYLIENKSIASLKAKLEKINMEDRESLYTMFSETLHSAGFSDKRDILLNMVDIARKSGNRLEYDFDAAGENWSYLYLQTIINGNNNTEQSEVKYNTHISAAKEFHRKMRDKNVIIIYKGDFSQKAVLSILRMLEKGLQQNHFENISEKKVMFHIITEMLQNVSKHSITIDGTRKGIFLVGKNVKGFFISTGNFIDNVKARNLQDQINQINTLNHEERNNLYRVILKTGVLTDNGGAGLGLIDIARETKNKFAYNFSPVNDNVTFLSLGVNY